MVNDHPHVKLLHEDNLGRLVGGCRNQRVAAKALGDKARQVGQIRIYEFGRQRRYPADEFVIGHRCEIGPLLCDVFL